MDKTTGILIGLAGAAIWAALAWFWNNILPRILQRFYRDEPIIAGKWKTTFQEGGKTYKENVTIKQKGRRVNGIITLLEEDGETTNYKFEGRFKNLILSCTYESTNPSDYEQGSFTLKYTRHLKLTGQHVLLSKTSDHLISSDYLWVRD